MRRTLLAALAAAAMLVTFNAPATAQAQFGAELNYSNDFDLGIGARAQFGLEQLGVENLFGIASFDYFFPDCGGVDCSYFELNANGAVQLPAEIGVPLYVGGGLNIAHSSVDMEILGQEADGSDTQLGLNILGGLRFPKALAALTPFVEARLELSGGEQFVISGGILF